MPILEKVRRTIEREGLFPAPGAVLVACSGGGDSVALLALLGELREELGLRLVVGHVNHGLRSRAADEDAAFVRELAAQRGLSFGLRNVDVGAVLGPHGGGLQAAARRLRYGALQEMAKAAGAPYIATGHTADDRAETLLLNLSRGAGARGLAALRARRGDGVVRPLLETERHELRAWLRGRKLPWREDRSNEDLSFRRIQVRRELLPWLREHLNPAIVSRLATTARLLEELSAVTEEAARAGLERARLSGAPGETHLSALVLAEYPPALRSMIVHQAARALGGGERGGELATIDRALRSRCAATLGPALELRLKDERWVLRGGRFRVGPIAERPLPLGVELRIEGWRVEADWALPQPASRGPWWVEIGDPCLPLRLRSRRTGDRFRPAGAPGRRKLTDFMIDRKLPAEIRNGIPLILDQKGILWVVGQRLADRALPDPAAARILRVRVKPPDWYPA